MDSFDVENTITHPRVLIINTERDPLKFVSHKRGHGSLFGKKTRNRMTFIDSLGQHLGSCYNLTKRYIYALSMFFYGLSAQVVLL